MSTHKPATPLPWAQGFAGDRITLYAATPKSPKHARADNFADADYIAHAANAYPRLIEALRRVTQAIPGSQACGVQIANAAALLREMGEEKQ